MHGCGEVALVNRSVIVLAKRGPAVRVWRARPRQAPAGRSNRRWEAQPRDPGRLGSRRPGAAGHRERGCAWGGCTRGVDNYLLVKLASSGVLRVHEPLLEATIKMAGTRAGSAVRSSQRGSAVRYQVARIGGPPSGLPRTWLGGRGPASLRCLCGWGAIAGWGAMDG
jgi:hypothetical protein